MDKVYVAIDLKSFYVSVECVERGLSLFNTEETIQSHENKERYLKKKEHCKKRCSRSNTNSERMPF